ncbi:MAG: hypothetical protein ACJ73D_10235 [Pyrinomonadaceae bacterium]
MRKIALSLTFLVALFVTGTVAQQNNDGLRVEHRIIDRMIDFLGNARETAPTGHGAAAPPVGSTGNTSALLPHTGPVINQPTIYLIWYGNWNRGNGTDTPAGQQIIRDWAANIGSSDYFRINATYSAKPVSGTAVYGGEYAYGGTSTSLSDTSILNIVSNTIGGGHLPYNSNGVYFVITPSNVNESSGFCSRYCGWHTDGTTSAGRHVRYSFVGNAARCINSCAIQSTSPNGNAGVDGAISVLSHELEEATTDPDLNAWYDSSGAENGDKCAWTFGNSYVAPNGSFANLHLGSRDFLIQRNLFFSGSAWHCARTSSGAQ